MNKNEMTPEVVALLDKITKFLKESCEHYVFEPITPSALHKLTRSINETFNRCCPEHMPVREYLTIELDPNDRNKVVMIPKPDSPVWVLNMLHMMCEEKYYE